MSVFRRGTKLPPPIPSIEIKVGILEGATYAPRSLVNAKTKAKYIDPRAGLPVALIAAWLEFGAAKMPARPFLQTTVSEKRNEWIESVGNLIKQGLPPVAVAALIGQVMKEDIQFTINEWPADNSQAWAESKGFNKGLIFTSQLLNSIDYAVNSDHK